jgi:hypothetical protein
MAKRLTREQKKEQAIVDIINKMFEIAGHPVTYDDIKDRKDNWFQEWTMTMAQGDEWRAWGEKYLKKALRLPAYRAELEMQWASLAWGLKYSDFPKTQQDANTEV